MEKKSEGIGENPFFWLVAIFLVTYYLWYVGGGPARWDAKFDRVVKEEGYPLFLKSKVNIKDAKIKN